MATRVVCRKCGTVFAVHTEHSARHVKCPGCHTVFNIVHAHPGDSPPARPESGRQGAGPLVDPAAVGSEGASALSDFLAEEIARPAPEASHGACCPACGRPYAKGEQWCGHCAGPSGDEPVRKRRSGHSSSSGPFTLGNRFASEDEAAERRRARQARSDWLTGWLVKGSGAAFIGAVVLYLFYRFVGAASDVGIEGVVGTLPVSAAHQINMNVKYLEVNVPRLPAFVDRKEKGVAVKDSTGNGAWFYAIRDSRQTWEYSSKTESLAKMWMNALQGMGYFREPSQQPPAIRIQEFTIREPTGRTWVMGTENHEAEHLCNLAVMLGCQSDASGFSPLLKVKRRSLAYAVFFSAVNEKMSLEQKIAHSCNPEDLNARTFAAEMLLSSLPQQQPDGADQGSFDKAKYESTLAQLAQPTAPDAKKKLYEKLLDSPGGKP